MTAAVERDGGDLSLAELNDVVHELVRSAKFQQAMIEDFALLAASVDPDGIEKLRTQAAVQLETVHQNRFTDPMSDENEAYWRARFCCLDLALARLGRFWKTAEIVSLDAAAGRVRRRSEAVQRQTRRGYDRNPPESSCEADPAPLKGRAERDS